MEDKVELIPAFFWICNKCYHENFERSIAYECSREEQRQILEEMNCEHNEGHLLMAPEVVKCKKCETEFETLDYCE